MGVNPGTSVSKYAFGAALTYAMAITAYTQFAVGILGPLITDDLGLTRTQFGSLTTVIFLVGGLSAPLIGPVVDLLGGRRMLVIIFCVAATSWIGMAVSPTYGWLLGASCVAGLVRGASNPVGNKLAVLHAPESSLGLLMGISKSGAQIGGFLAGVTLPVAALALGWRDVMYASVALAVVGLVATLSIIPRDESRQELAARQSSGGPARPLLVWLGPHAFLMGLGTGSVNAYLPLFAVERVGTTVARGGLVLGTMALVGIGGRILWGRQADRFSTVPLPLVFVAAGGGVALTCLAAASGGSHVLLWTGAIAYGLTGGSWIAVAMLAIVREVHVAVSGRTSGVILGLFYGGFGASPLLFGYTVDATGSYRTAWLTGVGALAGALAVAWAWHMVRRRRPVHQVDDDATRDDDGAQERSGPKTM